MYKFKDGSVSNLIVEDELFTSDLQLLTSLVGNRKGIVDNKQTLISILDQTRLFRLPFLKLTVYFPRDTGGLKLVSCDGVNDDPR